MINAYQKAKPEKSKLYRKTHMNTPPSHRLAAPYSVLLVRMYVCIYVCLDVCIGKWPSPTERGGMSTESRANFHHCTGWPSKPREPGQAHQSISNCVECEAARRRIVSRKILLAFADPHKTNRDLCADTCPRIGCAYKNKPVGLQHRG